MNLSKNRSSINGLSLTELMIAVALVGIGILGSIAAFGYISRSTQGSKARALATNLAQEKMQILMQKSYYEILVTTDPAYNTHFTPNVAYDPYFFPPESILEGSIQFTRTTYIQVVTEVDGQINVLPPDTPDTGMKQITVNVLWTAGNSASESSLLTLKNIINNPNTVMTNAAVTGTITNANTGIPISGALVDVAENIGWRDTSNNAGVYMIHLCPGSFDVVATAQGYFPKSISVSVPNSATPVSLPLSLSPISTGTIQGTAWVNNHLLISQVVPTTGTANDIEYVELYNPTTYSIYIGTNSATASPSVVPILWDQNGNQQMRHLYYANSYVPSYGYFLISNTNHTKDSTTAGCDSFKAGGVTLTPDACFIHLSYTSGGGYGSQHGFYQGDAGGVSLGNTSSYFGDLNFISANWPSLGKIDSVAWSDTTSGHPAPSSALEGTGMVSSNGVQAGEQFVRKTSTGAALGGYGNAYDAGVNSTDFVYASSITLAPHTSLSSLQVPLTGTPAVGAIVSVTDSLSAPSTAILTGNPSYAQFTVPGIATGTWSVFLDSGAASAEIDNVIVLTTTTTSVTNSTTTPPWPISGLYAINLTTSGVMGTVSGSVTNVAGGIISPAVNVTVGGITKPVGPTGYYAIRVTTGTYDVVANPASGNTTYASQTQNNVTINIGDVTTNVNFVLSQGGKISGFITRDGTNGLPGVSVVALDVNGVAYDTEVSGSDGSFLLLNLTTGTYTVQPVLDSKETSSPASASVAVTAGNTTAAGTFTVMGAMGTVSGTVKSGNLPIQTGVLIIVSTASVSFPPPALSSATLTSASYYADSSHENGTYDIDVRGSTTSLYNVYAFYEHLSGQTVIISSGVYNNVTVNSGLTTTNKNFTW